MKLLGDIDLLREPPQIYIFLDVMKKIQCFTRLAQGEITGLGVVEKRNNDLFVTDTFILKQKVSASNAEIDPLALNRFVAQHGKPNLKFQWHSHVTAPVFFSSTDKDTMRGFFGDFMLSMVINKKGDYRCRLDFYDPFCVGFEVSPLIILPVEEELIDLCRNEIREKVEDASFVKRKIQKALGTEDQLFRKWEQDENRVTAPIETLIREGEEE